LVEVEVKSNLILLDIWKFRMYDFGSMWHHYVI